jgi:hypothetical protein
LAAERRRNAEIGAPCVFYKSITATPPREIRRLGAFEPIVCSFAYHA